MQQNPTYSQNKLNSKTNINFEAGDYIVCILKEIFKVDVMYAQQLDWFVHLKCSAGRKLLSFLKRMQP